MEKETYYRDGADIYPQQRLPIHDPEDDSSHRTGHSANRFQPAPGINVWTQILVAPTRASTGDENRRAATVAHIYSCGVAYRHQ